LKTNKEMRKRTINFVMPVRSSVILSTWNNSSATGCVFMELFYVDLKDFGENTAIIKTPQK